MGRIALKWVHRNLIRNDEVDPEAIVCDVEDINAAENKGFHKIAKWMRKRLRRYWYEWGLLYAYDEEYTEST